MDETQERRRQFNEVFGRIRQAHAKLDVYQTTLNELLALWEPYARSFAAWNDPRTELSCCQAFLTHLDKWCSWDSLGFLVRRADVEAVLKKMLESATDDVLMIFWFAQKPSSRILTPADSTVPGRKVVKSWIWRETVQSLTEETISALKATLSTKEKMKAAMRLRGSAARSFMDLLDETLDAADAETRLHGQCLRALRKLSGRSCGIPTSCVLRDSDLKKQSHLPFASGGFGDVWLGIYQGQQVALKEIRLYVTSDQDQAKKNFCREAVLWKRLSHPNIVRCLGVSMTLGSQPCMASEWMDNGNIMVHLKRNPRVNRLQLLVDIARGLQYLHSIDVLHGDLKGGNILIDDSLHARLCDFGLTKFSANLTTSTNSRSTTTSSSGYGSIRWMAPELLDPELFNLSHYEPSAESDMYALGMVILEIFTGRAPFPELNEGAVTLKVMLGVRPARPFSATALGLSDNVWGVVEGCWQADRRLRPNVSSVLECLESALCTFVPVAEEELMDVVGRSQDEGRDSDVSSDDGTVVDETTKFRFWAAHHGLSATPRSLTPLAVA